MQADDPTLDELSLCFSVAHLHVARPGIAMDLASLVCKIFHGQFDVKATAHGFCLVPKHWISLLRHNGAHYGLRVFGRGPHQVDLPHGARPGQKPADRNPKVVSSRTKWPDFQLETAFA